MIEVIYIEEGDMAKRHFKFQKRGYTLVEIIIAMTILLLGMIPMGKFLVESFASSTQMGVYTQAEGVAGRLLDEIKAKKWDENQGDDGVTPAALRTDLSISASIESRENPNSELTNEDSLPLNKNIFNDIDDYRFFLEQAAVPVSGDLMRGGPKGFMQFTSSVTVQYVNIPTSGGNVTPTSGTGAGRTNYKQIIVFTQWTDTGGATRFVRVSQTMANYKKQ